MLSVNQLYFAREDRPLFENLSFRVNPGELLQIQGPNGSGKTTLLKLLAKFLTPDSGEIFFQDNIAYIGHLPAFTAWMTVQENLAFTQKLYGHSSDTRHPLLTQFSLDHQADFFPHQLSQGQKRRLAFASLLLSPAKLWILDEPFTTLDKHAVALIQNLIQNHLEAKGMVVMSTHQEIDWPIKIQKIVLNKETC